MGVSAPAFGLAASGRAGDRHTLADRAPLDPSPMRWFTWPLDYLVRVATSFEARLREDRPIVADGGLGVVLSAAVAGLRTPEEANLRAPDAVIAAHVSFINAGAELIETNTFGANRRKLAQHYLEDDVERINSAGVKLARDAREVTGRDVFIGGSIGPVGEHDGDAFAEQARILE